MENKREVTIDILKAIGILLIILAHTNPPGIIFQIRNFDVVLLVIISGLLGMQSYNRNNHIFKYIIKRITRLVVPVWIFLSVFIVLALVLSKIGIEINILNLNNILRSYLLIDGIGYVWIIRVYILCAITLPLLIKIKENFKEKRILIFIFGIYAIYEMLYYFIGDKNPVINYIVYYMIPYGIVCTYIGMKLKEMKNKHILIFSVVLILIFLIFVIYFRVAENRFIITNEYKYPPRLYYLSYSIAISLLLYYIIDRKNIFHIKTILNNSIILFISKHSMWIYLWHILFVFVINKMYSNVNFIIKYIIILIGGLGMTYIQTKIVKKVGIKNKILRAILDS